MVGNTHFDYQFFKPVKILTIAQDSL